MGKIVVGLVGLAACGAAPAQQPVPGDSWVYLSSTQQFGTAASAATNDNFHVVVEGRNTLGKPIFSGGARFGLRSDTCLYDVTYGRELPGEVPCGAPLMMGKTWTATPRDFADGGQQWLKVIGAQEFTIGGRVYRAVVISAVAEIPQLPALGHAVRHSRYYYVAEIKGMAKIVHELVNARGETVLRESFTLQDFHLTPAGP